MRMTCPACGAEMTLDVLMNTEAARDAVMAALALPAPLGKLLVQYLALFRPPKRQLTWERVASLFAELALPIAEAKFDRHGRTWPATLDYWRAGLEEIITKRDKLTLPLKSHGYLMEIIVGYGNKAEAVKETKREQDRAYPYSKDRNTNTATAVGDVIDQVISRQMPADARERLVKLGALKQPKKES